MVIVFLAITSVTGERKQLSACTNVQELIPARKKKTHKKAKEVEGGEGKIKEEEVEDSLRCVALLRMAFSASFYAGDELSCRIVPPQFAEDVTDPSPDRSFRRQTPPELRVVRRKKGADGSRKQ